MVDGWGAPAAEPDDFTDGDWFCGDPDCCCGDEPDDDAGHGDYAWRGGRAVPVETAAVDRGLL